MLSFLVFVVAHSRQWLLLPTRTLNGRHLLVPNPCVGVYLDSTRRLAVGSSERFDLSTLESALTDKHRVLPSFDRNHHSSSYLESTLTGTLVGIDSKQFTENANSFRCSTYK